MRWICILMFAATALGACASREPTFSQFETTCEMVVREATEIRMLPRKTKSVEAEEEQQSVLHDMYNIPPLETDAFDQAMTRSEMDLAAQSECEYWFLEAETEPSL